VLIRIVSDLKRNDHRQYKAINNPDSFLDFLFPTIKADVPARKQNIGAQKCDINLVKK
jgi:hypothetical protein